MASARHFTQPGVDPLEAGAPGEGRMPLVYERRSSIITNPDGSVVFKMEGAEIPAGWSQLATDIVVSKYFRKAGLHGDKEQGRDRRPRKSSIASRTPFVTPVRSFTGYFATSSDADAFEAELGWLMLVHQIRRVQLARVVQLQSLPRATASPARAETGPGTR